ncbi:MAG: hypothetical protein ABFD66_03625, partial [Smithella sp.]
SHKTEGGGMKKTNRALAEIIYRKWKKVENLNPQGFGEKWAYLMLCSMGFFPCKRSLKKIYSMVSREISFENFCNRYE